MRCLPITLLPLLLVACERQPVAPDQLARQELQAIRSVVTDTIDFVDDTSNCTANPRIGETLLFTGRLTYDVYTTAASSGNLNVTAFFTYDPGIRLVGQTSGTVWKIDAGRTHPMFHDNIHGAGESFEDAGTEYYTNASGAQLHLHANVHLTVNANGTIVVDRPLMWKCIGG